MIVILLSGIVFFGCEKPHQGAFEELVFIDHQNLRYVEEDSVVRNQVNEIKRNIDQAAKLGVNTYLLFAKETMEASLKYDFEVEGIGNIGKQALPPGCKHNEISSRITSAFREVIGYAKSKQIKVFIHSNQFIFPDEVLPIVKPAVWGTAICPGKSATWEIYRKKIAEFIQFFPDISGLQITGDETQVSVLECNCKDCSKIGYVERVNMLTSETAAVCSQFGMEVQMRTWQRMGELGDPVSMFKDIPDNVVYSFKNTDGDFRIANQFDSVFVGSRHPGRQIIEFDAWREYEGHNYFPCYMGDIWSPRFKKLNELGIKRIAVRLNWNSGKNQIFDHLWGNYVNIYTFLEMAKNPVKNPDIILNDFIRSYFPEKVWGEVFKLYKQSLLFQDKIFNFHGMYLAHHSRLLKDKAAVAEKLNDFQKSGFLLDKDEYHVQRKVIEDAYLQIDQLLEKIQDAVPEWAAELRKGALTEKLIALGIIDQMEIVFCIQNGMLPGKELLSEIKLRAAMWQNLDSESYTDMRGNMVLALLK